MFRKLDLAANILRTVSVNFGRNTSVVHLSTTSPWIQHTGSAVNIEGVLQHGKKHYPELFKTPSIDMTALHYAVQPHNDLKLMMECFGCFKGLSGSAVINLIIYPIARRSLQMTGAMTSLMLRTPPKNSDFGDFVRDLHQKHVMPVLPEIDMASKRAQYLNFMRNILHDESARVQFPLIFTQFDRYMAEGIARRTQGFIQLSDAELKEVAIMLIADKQLQKETDKILHGLVETRIESLVDRGECESLVLVSPIRAETFLGLQEKAKISYPHRLTALLAGGPGSGKSISAETFALQLKKLIGIGLEDMAVLNVDRMRTIFYEEECVKEAEKKNVGTLTHDEAVMSFNMTHEFTLLRIAQEKKIPHCLQEMCGVWPEWINLALEGDGQFIVTISTRIPEKAVEGVIARGIEQNEVITPPEYVLWSYKSVSERFPFVVQESQSKKMSLVVINNELAIEKKFNPSNVHEPIDRKPSVVVDCETNTVYIINLQQYLEFLDHSQINVRAVSAEEIYKGGDISMQSSMARAIDPKRFGSAKIAFVRPDVDSTAISNLAKNVVATVQDNQLVVLEAEQFEVLKQGAPEHFEALEDQTSHIRTLDA